MPRFTSLPTLTYATAAEAVALAIDLGAQAGLKAVVTVTDAAMLPMAFGRADGATPHSIETSRRKAATASSTRKPTSALDPRLAPALASATGGVLTDVAGGVPLAFDGNHLGGLGVAGGAPEDDARIALAVLEALGADLPGGAR